MRSLARLTVVCTFLLLLTASAAARSKPLQLFRGRGRRAADIDREPFRAIVTDRRRMAEFRRTRYRSHSGDRLAGVKRIEVLVVTHYHRDHVGGVIHLSDRIPVVTFIDHGPHVQTWDTPGEDYAVYLKVAERAHHAVEKPGDILPIKGMTVQVVSSGGRLITQTLPGDGQSNGYCGSEPGENAHSVGTLLAHGKFRFIDLGDLTRKKELALVCPKNLIGTVDLFLVSHHGFAGSTSKAIGVDVTSSWRS